jgi:hypothetical protein
MRRLSHAGFKKDFVHSAILPDWWDETCEETPSLLTDVEIRVARFLGLSVSAIRDPAVELSPPSYAGAQLRRVRDIDRDRLAPAIHSALQIAAALVRNLRAPVPSPSIPPADGLMWRAQIQHVGTAITLNDVVSNLWERGIPIAAIDVLPAPSFQGLACVVGGRPVVLLGHKHDEPGRVAFFAAHEIGHIASGDCAPDRPVVDEQEEVADDADMEIRADQYATHVLVGKDTVPKVDAKNARELAIHAGQFERSSGIDAGAVIFAWARLTGDYAKASMAVKALYRGSGARRLLRQHFDRYVDLDSATESDRALLRCVFGDPERDATAR